MVLKFPNITIKMTKMVESVQLNGVVMSFVVVLKFPNITIRKTKTVEATAFVLLLTQTHCPVI